MKDLVGKHKVGVVAIGNGTACRETQELIAEIITEGTHFHNNPDVALPYTPPSAPLGRLVEPGIPGNAESTGECRIQPRAGRVREPKR